MIARMIDTLPNLTFALRLNMYSLRFNIQVTFGEISLKLRQTNWNVVRINVNVVVDLFDISFDNIIGV
jgi:hypothetical protein